MKLVPLLALLGLLLSSACAQQGKTILLPPSAAEELRRMHWIDAKEVGGYWPPTAEQMAALEKDLPHIAALSAETGVKGAHILNPAKDNRQYVALSVNGRRVIFIHAFCLPPSTSWSSHIEIILDGGACVWEAIYDVETRSFSHLVTNGVA
jgi:hypothetical protein